jgi:hypothetical protein
MDILSAMFRAAEHAGVLAELTAAGLMHRVSLYADNIVVFARPEDGELVAARDILECFGAASGREVSYTKSSIASIRCSDDLVAGVAPILQCPTRPLPCTYLGLPLSIRPLTKTELQPLIDKLASKLAF